MKTPTAPKARVLTLEEFAQHLRDEWPRIWKASLRSGRPFPPLEFSRKAPPPLADGELVFRRARIAELCGLTRALFSKMESSPRAPALLSDQSYDVPAWRRFARKRGKAE
jgi:hypothetical protein